MFGSTRFLDQKLIRMLGRDPADLSVHKAVFPGFRLVDFYFAAKSYAGSLGSVQHLNAQSHVDLAPLLQERNMHMQRQQIVSATTSTWPKAPDAEEAIATDGFFVIHAADEALVIRVRFIEYAQNCVIEIAGTRPDGPAEHMARIEEQATAQSIYRGQMLHFAYQAARKDQYGDVESPEKLQVTFAHTSSIGDDEIILGDSLRALLTRNVVDLFKRRDILAEHDIPTRRGVLLYGPPGTGKTFACRHICHQLPETTKIFVTGASLGNVAAIFTLARLLQPTIVFIEDADLMFSSREINLYSSSLGELMDQLDGLRPREDVSVVMTTNAIERIESALKDRPGRISQCIFMGAPTADLRRRLIAHLLADHHLADEDMDALVAETKGASQAFLKEWIFRGLQIGCERLATAGEPLVPERADFLDALNEMKSVDEHSGRIIGFQAS